MSALLPLPAINVPSSKMGRAQAHYPNLCYATLKLKFNGFPLQYFIFYIDHTLLNILSPSVFFF